MMQGIHHHNHQQQQLAALLTAALPKDDSVKKSSTAPAAVSSSPPSEEDESSRLAAITSLHRAILYPPNSLLVTHSASFLAQGFSQLLTDKSYSVRHAAATAYGALCSVLCSISISSNGRQNHVLIGSVIDRFIGWSLPHMRNNDNQTSELSLESLREFLNVGEVGAVERYALPILKACQELLEDEKTSINLLPRLLGLLTLISLKFFRCFQPHFVDIVDLLLGWAMVPDISESDKRVIMDSFLQFQKHWVNNLQFSLGLLSKFLDDMDMLLQDGSPGTPQQFKRLLALLSCFCTVLQSVASGLLEINYLEQISEPLSQMVPVLLRCLSMVGRTFGWSKWIEDSWRCLTLLAEILGDKFSTFYSIAVDILFQSLAVGNNNQVKLSALKVHGVLKTNLQLLSLQKLGLMTSSVDKILQFDGPVSQLRLHPNHLVTGSAAATYIFLLQHGKNDITVKTMDSLIEEIQLLKCKIEKNPGKGDELEMMVASKFYSLSELAALIKFNLKVLLSCVALPRAGSLIWQAEIDSLYLHRVEKLVKFITDRLDPCKLPITSSVDLQVTVIRTLERLSSIEFMKKCSIRKRNIGKISYETSSGEHLEEETLRDIYPSIVFGHLKRYNEFLIRALDIYSPLAVKIEALKWMHKFCESVLNIYANIHNPIYPCQAVECCKTIQDLLLSTLVAASDREPKVRSLVATVLDALLRAKIIHPMRFPIIAETILEKLGDPENDIKSLYLKLLSHVLPLSIYVCGLSESVETTTWQPHVRALAGCTLHWKQVFALKQLPQQLHSQQLVSVLNYISQRWKVPLSSWIQRLILSCRKKKDHATIHPEAEITDHHRLWLDIKVEEDFVESICSVNLLAGAWWAIHEAARFCITTRLRTNLGGPTQTFAALERMLRDIAHVLQLETEQNDGNLSIIGSHAHLLPMRLLLEFVESLKKNVYNAYEGSTVLVHAPRTSSLFFRANKKVCEEWFSRINEPMMDAGMALQCHDATVHYCALRLQDFRAQITEHIQNLKGRHAGDVLRIARNMSLVLCKKQEPEALAGFQKWLTMAFSPLFSEENQVSNSGHFSWITGLVYQARGHHEKAAAHFIHLLQDEESLSSMGSNGIQFIIARIIESYTAISDWKSLESWLTELQTIRGKYAGKSFAGALTTAGNEINAIQALACFDEDDFTAAWSYLDLTPKSSSELTLDSRVALQRSEQMLLQAMLLHVEGKAEKVPDELQKAKLILEEAFSVLPLDGLVEAAPHVNQLYCISAFEEGCKLGDSQGKSVQSLLGTYIQNTQFLCNRVHQDCSSWLKVMRVYQRSLPNSPTTLELCRNLMILARKQKNLGLATRLNNYLKSHVSLCSDEIFRDYFIPTLEYENILLMRVENDHEGALTNLWSFLRPSMVSSSNAASWSQNDVLMAKACLKLSNWLHKDLSGKNFSGVVLKMQADFNRSEISGPGTEPLTFSVDEGCKPRVSHIIEEIVGTSRKLSTRLCPIMGKTWISYASWCYTQARASISSENEAALRSCSFSPILATEIQAERFVLSKEEKLRVKEIISKLILERSEELLEETRDCDISNDLRHFQQQIIDVIETAAGAPVAEDSSSNSLTDAVFSQMQKCLLSSAFTLDEAKVAPVLGDLVDVWWVLRKRRISLFGHAAHAFINYLSYSSLKCFGGQLTGLDVDPKYKHFNYTLRAMLFVLKILVNYGVELKDTLEAALSKVPMLPWQEITPQLFAQLSSHPEKVVRKQLETLLVMLGKLSPWSLVYPTLVDANSQEKEPSEELQKILAYLNKLYPRLVQDAQLMIKELENVTVLWEELWLGTLQDLHADVMRRINLLKEEAARIAANKTLNHGEKNKINAAKYSAMMAPIVVVLERRLASTSRKPETPHEVWFLEEYLTQIKSAVTKFKTPPASVAVLGDVWRPFETIATSLASYQRKSSISISEVAPQLASFLSSDAPMPGLEKQITVSESESSLNQEIVTIASFSEEFVILPTKTKPKKLVIVGSDGLKYTYLLKGREDLRLDARIMQLLQAVNGFLQSSSSTHGQSLGIRYYSVTPISGRAGLIQWVDNLISIYSIFKSWQNRIKLSELSALGGDGNGAVPAPVPRPSDMFYGKIIPALKEKGIRRVISRRDWPHDVKRKVLLDLMKETPKQLLQQELWCASEGFKAYSSKSKRYSGSVAAMSIVGHILGLGDRHLDNILIDFCSGDIVHIDYNVCFDKGQRLKIPEIVPFRLTQTIESALGLTGVEGTFRANCESVLGVLKKNKDIILMLLEVFVWDPLVEWTRANFHDDAAVVGEERKGMELAVSLSLFASRVQEIRVPLQEHHDLLLSTLSAVESAIERFASILNQYETVSSHFFRADQERSTLLLHETSAKLVVAEATTNSEKSHLLFEMQARDFTQAQAMVMEKGREAAGWIDQHGRVLDALRNSSIPEIKVSIKLNGSEEALSLTSAVSGAGVPLTVVPEPTQIQCHDIDREVSHLVTELDHGLSSAVGALQMYSLALQRVLPLNYVTTSPVYSWAQVLLSLNTLSPDLMLAARRQGADLVNKGHVDGFKDVYDGLCLKATKYAADIERLEEEHVELLASIGPGSESKAKERVLSAFKNYIQKDSGPVKHEIERNKESVLNILDTAVINMFSDVKHNVQKSVDLIRNTNSGFQSDPESFSSELEEQIEKCSRVTEFANELKHDVGLYIREVEADANSSTFSIFKDSLQLSKNLVGKMTEVVLPSAIKSVLSFNSDVAEISESVSHIRRSVDTALEQLIQVELERISLIELESNYFVKVGRITEQQLALEEASVNGRDNLSWEEAEELASQEETCRVQLDQLHQIWNQKDRRISSLMEKEAIINSSLANSELQFQSLITAEEETESHLFRRKSLLLALLEPFSELELVDQELVSFAGPDSDSLSQILYFADLINSGCSVSEYIWNFPGLVRHHAFFIWKVSMVDLLLGSCTHDILSSLDQKKGFDQLVDVIKRRVRNQIQDHVIKYLRDRVAPIFFTRLDREIEMSISQLNTDSEAVRRVQLMLEEFCNAHETFRAARSAASIMKRQINELKDAFVETSLEISQMEWMYNVTSTPFVHSRLNFRKFFPDDDNFLPVILNINRPKLVEAMQSSVAKIARSLEGLKSCEGTFAKAEAQLERAMSWACGGPGSSSVSNVSARNSGIPSEFHDHLIKRRQILQEAQENASDIMKVCISILEFEASRDGVFRGTGEIYASRPGADGGMWQQNYVNALTKLDVVYHSFTRAEQEWKLAQSDMEVASNGLVSATNELRVASVKAKAASDDLQSTLIAMRDSAYEASVALSAYGGIIRGHSALTSECGSMLEEVLAITEGLADVHSLGKEAAALQFSLMEYLSKANAVLIPLDAMLSKDVAAMTDAMSRENDVNLDIAPIHGQAIFQSYHKRVDETLQVFKPLVSSLTSSVKGLYSMLIRLAKAASLHAGNLHKALEGLGESLQVESQEVDPLRENLSGPDAAAEYDDIQESEQFEKSDGENDGNVTSIGLDELALSDRGWISPPESIYSDSSDSGVASSEANISDDTCVNLDTNLPTSGGPDTQDNVDLKNEQENSDTYSEHNDEASLLNQEKLEDESGGKKSLAKIETGNQAPGGKNAYAMSILRRVEMKIDGRDITDNREITVAEQVDFLTRQATNVDNLCNMYEGWTPWI